MPEPFWLMMASTAIAVLPTWRSPMISSRWPRPIGTIASIAFKTDLHRLVYRFTGDYARGNFFQCVGHLWH
jgi:hypothetical protein